MSLASDLLRIDADAAVRKLSENRFKSPSESIVALIRLAASTLPESIRISIVRGCVDIKTNGGMIDGAVFRNAAALFDSTLTHAVRLAALQHLENDSGMSFLAAFAESPAEVRVEWRQKGDKRGIAFLQGKRPDIYSPKKERAFRIVIHGKIGNPSRIPVIAEHCRFAEVPIYINQAPVSRGLVLPDCFIERPLETGAYKGVIGIPREGDLSSLIRLENGIVIEDALLGERRGLVIHAVVENAGKDLDNRDIYDRLREAGRDLYREAASRYNSLKEHDRNCAKERLLSRYEHSFDRDLVAGIRVFSVLGGSSADLFEIKQRLRREVVFAVDKSCCLSQFITRNRFVLLLDAKEKKFINATLGVSPPLPPLRIRFSTVGFVMDKWARQFLDIFSAFGKTIDDASLSAKEHRFLNTMRERLGGDFEIVFSTARRSPKMTRNANKTILRIPQRHPRIRAMIDAVARDPVYIDWALSLLSRGALPFQSPK